MNLRSFVNLFDSAPQINIGNSSTNKHPACMVDFQPVEMLITGQNSIKFFIHNGGNKEYFRSHRSISSIRYNGTSFDIKLEGFYEETKPVSLIDLIYCLSQGLTDGKAQRVTISNYDITFNILKDGELPKFFTKHPEYLERSVKGMWYSKDMDSLCIHLEYEFLEIMGCICSNL